MTVAAIPVSAAAQGVKAQLRIIRPLAPGEDPVVPLRFNPTEYQISKSNTFAEVPIPGLEEPLIQYIRGGSEKLSLEVLVDTSDTLDDVRDRYVNRLRQLMSPNPKEHAPPIVAFEWAARSSRACWRAWVSPMCCSPRAAGRCAPGSVCR